jgi:hypothetical protein
MPLGTFRALGAQEYTFSAVEGDALNAGSTADLRKAERIVKVERGHVLG